MRAWPHPTVPRLPGTGPTPMLHDTATGQMSPVTTSDALRLYVCGITPYDAAHLGHASTYIAFDLVQRAGIDAGLTVDYVQNVTDIDDPLLERAAATGDDWRDLAVRQLDRYRDDMAALAVLPPRALVGVVEAMDLVIGLIERFVQAGLAYKVDDDLYFDVRADPAFGELAGLSADQMLATFAERGGDPGRFGKRDPLDCLLWSAERPGEPAWDAPFGRGRPGWHVECVAIAQEGLGAAFELQGGGSDLVFPHHQMCASLAHALDGLPFAQHYAHAGMVALDGEKMSKSKGNLEFVGRLRDQGAEPPAIRLALLAHHYRSDWEWTAGDLERAQQRVAVWRTALDRSAAPSGAAVLAGLRAALADDLNAPRALSVVDDWSSTTGDDPDASQTVRTAIDALLGVQL